MLLYTSFFGNVGGLPAAPIPAADYFAENGSSHPWYSNGTSPSAFYDSSSQTTWKAWESFHDSGRYIQVTTYNHSTGKWSGIHDVAKVPLTDDDHGVPAICMDHQGYVHCFYGPHDGDMLHSVTVAANDPSQWRLQTTFTGSFSYPHPVLVGSTLYLFMRQGPLSNKIAVRFKTTSLSGGAATFGSQQSIITFLDGVTGQRVYLGVPIVSGTDIHFAAMKSNDLDTSRQHVYHFVYDTTDDSIHNAANSFDTVVGSQPITWTSANSNYRVVDFGSDGGDHPAFCIDGNGDLQIVYARGSSDPYTLYHTIFSGGSWSAPASIGSIDGVQKQNFTDGICIVPILGANVDIYYPNNKGSFTYGGDLKRRRYQSGSWGSETTILAAGSNAISHPSTVRNGHANARVFFTEIKQNSLDSNAGGLKMYGYGDNGFLTRQPQAPTDITLTSTTVVAGASTGTVIGQLQAVDTDYLDTFTWSIVSDPDGKFSISGNELETAASISYPNSHSVTIRATDSFGNVKTETFTITVVQATVDLVDSFFSSVVYALDQSNRGEGTDANWSSVVYLIDDSK